MPLKKFVFFLFFYFTFLQAAHSQIHDSVYAKFDNLFKEKKYIEAEALLNNQIKKNKQLPINAILKMAYIQEKKGDFAKSLYFHSLYFERKPSQLLLEKMSEMAKTNNIEGFKLSDFFIIQLLAKQYSYIILVLLLLVGVYVTTILVQKKRKSDYIKPQQKIALFLYVIFLISLVFIKFYYKQGIVNQPMASLRIDPSNAAEVVEFLKPGHRINILGSDDVWLRILRGKEILYINKNNVWLIN